MFCFVFDRDFIIVKKVEARRGWVEEARRRRSRIRRSDSSVGRVGWYTVKILKRRRSFEKATNRVENLKTEVRRCFFVKAIVAQHLKAKNSGEVCDIFVVVCFQNVIKKSKFCFATIFSIVSLNSVFALKFLYCCLFSNRISKYINV